MPSKSKNKSMHKTNKNAPKPSNKTIKLDTSTPEVYNTKQALFWGTSETSLYLQGLLYDAVRDIHHPEKGRFGAHFLLFPLLSVSKHFRSNVGSYLFKVCFTNKAPGFNYPRYSPTHSHLVITRFVLRGELADERNDPRYWFSAASNPHTSIDGHEENADLQHWILPNKPTLNANSIDLRMTFACPDPQFPDSISQVSVENPKTGRKYSDVPMGVTLFSSAAFTPVVDEQMNEMKDGLMLFDPVEDFDIHAMTVCDIGFHMSADKRWGSRSAVPLPPGYEIDYAWGLFPDWPDTANPAKRKITNENWKDYSITYTTALHTVDDFLAGSTSFVPIHDEAGNEISNAQYNRKMDAMVKKYKQEKASMERSSNIARRRLVAMRVHEISGPLMRFLRPSITKKQLPKFDP